MGSRGSVIPVFLEQNRHKTNPFTVTDKKMTRFNITLSESASFVLNCIKSMKGSEVFVPKLPSYRIMDLVKAINPKKKVKVIGVRPGEKIHEELITASDFNKIIEKKSHYIIDSKINKKNNKFKSYNSFDNLDYLSIKQIKRLIEKNKSDFDKQ